MSGRPGLLWGGTGGQAPGNTCPRNRGWVLDRRSWAVRPFPGRLRPASDAGIILRQRVRNRLNLTWTRSCGLSTTAAPGPPPASIYDLQPLDFGGIHARGGFAFQDHLAAGFCLDMLGDPTLAEVWCETLDDVVIIWNLPDGFCVEFVQVKASALKRLWSVAKLCEKEEGAAPTS